MIQIGSTTLDLSDPLTLAMVIGGALAFAALILLWMSLRASTRAAGLAEPMILQMNDLTKRVEGLSGGQQQLAGGLAQAAETQAKSQAQMLHLMEQRLQDVSPRVHENLQGSATRTARSLGDLQQRLETIDKAQANIEKLSGDVLTLQDILSNKQTRGAFG